MQATKRFIATSLGFPSLLCFMAGAWSGSATQAVPSHLSAWFWGLWFGLALVITLMSLLWSYGQARTELRIWCTLLAFLLGGLYFNLAHYQPEADNLLRWAGRSEAVIEGDVLESRGHQWVVQTRQVNHHPGRGKFILYPPRSSVESYSPGQQVVIRGQITEPFGQRFDGDFDYRGFLLQQHISAMVFAKEVTPQPGRLLSPRLWLLRLTEEMRLRITGQFEAHLPKSEAQVLASIVLGEHGAGLDRDVKNQFIQSGLIHILAASGLNVGLIGAFLLAMGQWLRLPFRLNLGLAMAGVGLYCMMTGLPPSVQRAGLMLELALMLKLLNRQLSPLYLLAITGALLTIINPWIVAMVGFQLSFLSTLGLLAMVPPLQEAWGFYITKWLAGLILVPLVAQLWVMPVLLYSFNQIHPWSLPANWVALPCAAVLTYIGFALGGLSLIVPKLAGWGLHFTLWPVMLLKWTAQFFSQLPWANWTLSSPPPITILLCYAMLGLWTISLYFPHRLPLKQLTGSLLFLALCPAAVQNWISHHQSHVHFLAHRNGAVTQIIEDQSGLVIVNTSASGSYWDRDLLRVCQHEGIGRIDVMNLTDPNRVSLGPLEKLAQTIPINRLLIPQGVHVTSQQVTALPNTTIIPLAPTEHLQVGQFHAALYSLPHSETLQRFTWGPLCLANHRGQASLNQSLLKELGQSCLLAQDQVGSIPATLQWQNHPTVEPLNRTWTLWVDPRKVSYRKPLPALR